MASPNTIEIQRSLPRPTVTVWRGHASRPRYSMPGVAAWGKPMPINRPFTMANGRTYICDHRGVLRRHE